MTFHSVLLFLFWWQSVGGENVENTSIKSVLGQVAIPTKIINEFFKRPLSSKTFYTDEHINGSTIRYENSNDFVPFINSGQSFESRRNKRNLTRVSTDSLSKDTLKKMNSKTEDFILSTEINNFHNFSNLSKNHRLYYVDNKQSEVELLKMSKNTPTVANYSLFYENTEESPISTNFYNRTNLNKSFNSKDQKQNNWIRNYFGRHNSINNSNIQYIHGELKKDYNIKGVKKQTEITEEKSLPKTNYASVNSSKSSLNSYIYVDKNEKAKFKKLNIIEPSQYKVDSRFMGQSVKSAISISNPYTDTKNKIGFVNIEQQVYKPLPSKEWTNRKYEFINAQGSSEENLDYIDEIDKSRIIYKINNKSPSHFDVLGKIPKDYREMYDIYDDQESKHLIAKSKSNYRQKLKPVQITNNEGKYDNECNTNKNPNDMINQHNFNEENSWNQFSKNGKVSNTNGFEISQIENPKLHIIPFNILSNFDHDTAISNSQGFDITNAMFTGIVRDRSLVSTATPLLSSTNYIVSSTVKPQLELATSASDVKKSSFHNSVHAVLMPNKLQHNMLNQYLQSTVSPAIFAVTPSSIYSTSTIVPNLQHILNQVQVSFPFNQQLMTIKPIHEAISNLLYTTQSNTNTQIYISPNATQKQNLHLHQNSQSIASRSNNNRSENKKKVNGNSGEFLASASLSVETNIDDDSINSKTNIITNDDTEHNMQNNEQTRQTFNTLLQPTIVPAFLHTGIGLFNNNNQNLISNPLFLTNSQSNQQIIRAANDALQNTMQQLQYDIRNNRYQLTDITGIDSTGAANNDINTINNIINPLQKAQLPIFGANKVEIINPNLKTSTYAINPIPTTLVTTPIPIFATTGLIAMKQPFLSTTQESTDDRSLYNPVNFVPSYDLIKNQSILNDNIVRNERKKLNFIPPYSIGSIYKNAQGEEVDLLNKYKNSLDLEKYAEEMFKESLRTIYNSQKWNNDPRSSRNISLVDNSDNAKLRNELLRIKSNIQNSKFPSDILEAHHTENKIRTAKPRYVFKRPDSSNDQYKYGNKPNFKTTRKPHHYSHHYRHQSKINDFLTPPKISSYISKNAFYNILQKTRSNDGPRLNSRRRPRQLIISSKSKGIEAETSTIGDYKYAIKQNQQNSQYNQPNYEGLQFITFRH